MQAGVLGVAIPQGPPGGLPGGGVQGIVVASEPVRALWHRSRGLDPDARTLPPCPAPSPLPRLPAPLRSLLPELQDARGGRPAGPALPPASAPGSPPRGGAHEPQAPLATSTGERGRPGKAGWVTPADAATPNYKSRQASGLLADHLQRRYPPKFHGKCISLLAFVGMNQGWEAGCRWSSVPQRRKTLLASLGQTSGTNSLQV